MIPALPRLAPWYRLAACDDRVVLEYGQRIVCLEGRAAARLIPALLPLLDGTRTLDEIAAVLGEPARPAIEAVLERLVTHELLVDGPSLPLDLPAPVAGSVELLAALRGGAVAVGEVSSALAARTVAVVGDGRTADEVHRLLGSSGVDVRRAETMQTGVDLVVGAPSPAQLPLLGEWNRTALGARQPWLQVLPFDGRYASVGPLYLPGETCCFECFRRRRLANLGATDELALLEVTPAPYPSMPALEALAAGIAGTLALEWLVLHDHHVPSAFYAVELASALDVSLHHVHRVPRCPACSGLAEVAAPLPWHKEVAVAHV